MRGGLTAILQGRRGEPHPTKVSSELDEVSSELDEVSSKLDEVSSELDEVSSELDSHDLYSGTADGGHRVNNKILKIACK